jgi:hypothetical protein
MHFATAEAQGSISTSPGCFADLFFLEHTQHNEPGARADAVFRRQWRLPTDRGRVTGYSAGNKRVSRLFSFTTDSVPLSPARKLSLSKSRSMTSLLISPIAVSESLS